MFRILLLGAASVIQWTSIRDFWVKTSMFGFFIKSSKRFKKTWEKNENKKMKITPVISQDVLLSLSLLSEPGAEPLIEKRNSKS